MKRTPGRKALRIVLWVVVAVVALGAASLICLSVLTSPTYVYRDLFVDLGDTNDWQYFPSRPLAAAPAPQPFAAGTSGESAVQTAFASQDRGELDSFLAGTGTDAFVVIRKDAIVYERYFGETKRDTIVTSFSVAKSFTSLLVGIAVAEGRIGSVEDPITKYLPELAERDPRFADITIRHLLTMSSGLRWEPDKLFLGDDSLTYEFDDLRHLALSHTEIAEQPGKTFLYNDYNPILVGMILERATGTSVTGYLQEKVWNPLGMEYDASWSVDSEKNGLEKMASGINARAVDFARLGRLYLAHGRAGGAQVVPAAWVKTSTSDAGIARGLPVEYGYFWWGRPGGLQRDYFAMGDHGQFVWVAPDKDLIIARFGSRYGLEGEQEEWAQVLSQLAAAL
jgi:CubicO group peptidase (beta-lactamase class C family)